MPLKQRNQITFTIKDTCTCMHICMHNAIHSCVISTQISMFRKSLLFRQVLTFSTRKVTNSTFFFQPRSDLAALLQILCSIFSAQSPVYAKSAPTPTQPSNYNRPQHPGYPAQYPPGYPPSNQAGSLPYPVGGPARMPMPTPKPMPGKCKKTVFVNIFKVAEYSF